jgi:hypothetical protein
MPVVTFQWLLKGAMAAAVVVLAAACAPGGNSPDVARPQQPLASATSSPAPVLAFCRDVDGLRATLQTLTPVKGSLRTSREMKAAAQEVQSNLTRLGRRSEWRTQIDNLKAASANMRSAADSLAASPGARGVASNARIAVARVNDAIRRLVTAVGSRCPSPSPGEGGDLGELPG